MTEPETGSSTGHGRVDRLGAFASTACAIHCAACAFIPAAFAVLGLDFLLGHEAEWGLTLVAVGLGLTALYLGWRNHGNRTVLLTLSIGIIGLLAARGLESGGHHDEHHEEGAHAVANEEGNHKAKEADTEHDNEHASESEHEDAGHLIGGIVGVFAGLILMLGHLFNLRQMRLVGGRELASAETE